MYINIVETDLSKFQNFQQTKKQKKFNNMFIKINKIKINFF